MIRNSNSLRPAVVANGASLSGVVAVDLDQYLVAIEMPTTWTAANLTFQVSVDGTTYRNLYNNSGSETTVTAGADRVIHVDREQFVGIHYLKVRSGTAGVPVNQGGDRTINLVFVNN
jgi:hypothetical protein